MSRRPLVDRAFRLCARVHYRRSVSSSPAPKVRSEQQLCSDLDLPRVEPGARDHTEVGCSQLRPGLVPDRTVREVEGLDAKLDELRATQLEPLVGRRIQADDSWSNQRIARHGAVAERPGRI